jgi:hypothetical protein
MLSEPFAATQTKDWKTGNRGGRKISQGEKNQYR